MYSKATYVKPYIKKFIRILGINNVGTLNKPKMNVIYAILANNGIKPIDKNQYGVPLYQYSDLDGLNDTSIIAGFHKWKDDMLRKDIELSMKDEKITNPQPPKTKQPDTQTQISFFDENDDKLYESLFNKRNSKGELKKVQQQLAESKKNKPQWEVRFNKSHRLDKTFTDWANKGKLNPKIGKGWYCGGTIFKVVDIKDNVIYIEKDMSLNESEKKKVAKNEEGKIVPEICPECGSKVGLYIEGEPVYLCSNEKCKKYFGTMPKIHENINTTKKVYLTEAQIQYIKEYIENQVKEDKYIKNEYNEKWLRLPVNSEIFKKIKKVIDFSNKSNLGLADVAKVISGDEWEEDENPYYVAIIHGGLNGNGKWQDYLKDIAKIIKEIPTSYLIDLDIDVCDDVWTLQLGFHQGQLNEGAWGYKPEESDSYLDLSHELGEPIIKILSKKLPKYVNNPKNNDGNIYYWLGLMLDMLKVKAFHESWLYRVDDSHKKDNKYEIIRNLFAIANKGFDYLLTDNTKDNRQGWDKFDEYESCLKKMYTEFKKLEDYYNMDKNNPQGADELIKESYVQPEKVLLIKRYLDDNFVRADMPIIGDDGYPKTIKLVGMKGADGNIVKNMTAKQLFYLLQDKFKGVYGDKKKRDAFIKQTMIDWYNKKITKDGLLSKNFY